MVSAVVFEFSVMRCQPLRRALASNSKRRIYDQKNRVFQSNNTL
ncbi:acetyltransferase [Vibrio cholerae]|nr:acetyltransferase [Vibrio cholerae]